MLAGEEVVIARANQPPIRMVPFNHDTRPRTGGQWSGQVEMGDDFEFSDEELVSLFEGPISDGLQ